ncbi:MAG: hypothetical protein H0X37_13160 [Herpetosiphonaceae bacterium]|nr:hypothetical protein [Herpetosiphonaceae bacterium]
MSENVPPVSAQHDQIATHIGELAQRAAQAEAQIQTLDRQLAAAEGQQRRDLEGQLRALVAEYSSLIKEANALRGQLGLPVVVPVVPLPAIMTDQPASHPEDEWTTTQGT